MLKSLYPRIEWQFIKAVGFDLDGTLYDEFQFVEQVYRPVAAYLATECAGEEYRIFSYMIERWLEKGSSYTHIFEEVLYRHGLMLGNCLHIIHECLNLYRKFTPELSLPSRVSWLMDYFKKNEYALFIITDGNEQLQSAKYYALGLERWIEADNLAISGHYGSDFQKPSVAMTHKIRILKTDILPEEVVYFGDREIDRIFAAGAGFQFVPVHCLVSRE